MFQGNAFQGDAFQDGANAIAVIAESPPLGGYSSPPPPFVWRQEISLRLAARDPPDRVRGRGRLLIRGTGAIREDDDRVRGTAVLTLTLALHAIDPPDRVFGRGHTRRDDDDIMAALNALLPLLRKAA